jgi:hypothetical protein
VDTTVALSSADANVQEALEACIVAQGVGGVTHADNDVKTGVSGVLRLDEVASNLVLDVTVVIENRNSVSTFFYSGYTIFLRGDVMGNVSTDAPTFAMLTPSPTPQPSTSMPTIMPTTLIPTSNPTLPPTQQPSSTVETSSPTFMPVSTGTTAPTSSPTFSSVVATLAPTFFETSSSPSHVPTSRPSLRPSAAISDSFDEQVLPHPDIEGLPLSDEEGGCTVDTPCTICQGGTYLGVVLDNFAALGLRLGPLGLSDVTWWSHLFISSCFCVADCDTNDQCAGDLECYSRPGDDSSPVPGCQGLGTPGADYCYEPSASLLRLRTPKCSSEYPW